MNTADPLLPERLPDESPRWHARFVAFSRLPPAARTLERVWRQESGAATVKASATGSRRRPPGAWNRACARFRWVERAAALDADAQRREAEEVAITRRAERDRRRHLAAVFLERVSALAGDAIAVRAHPAGVARAVATALEQSRLEFGSDEPPKAAVGEKIPTLAAAPVLKIVFEEAATHDAPPVSERAAEAGGFVFTRS